MSVCVFPPPVGLNIFVIKSIAPDIPLRDVIWGVMPFVALMIFAVIVLCIFPDIATWWADAVLGGGDEHIVLRRVVADDLGTGAVAARPHPGAARADLRIHRKP